MTATSGPSAYGIVAPRYNTQQFGILVSLVVLAAALFMLSSPRLRGVRFWRTVALLGAGLFALGFWRADPVGTFAGLRLDQWLDLVMVAFSVFVASRQLSGVRKKSIRQAS